METKKVIRLNNDFTNAKLQEKIAPAPKRKHLGIILVVAMLLFSLASMSLVQSYENLQKQKGLEQQAIQQNTQLASDAKIKSAEIQKLKDPNFVLKYARSRYDYSNPGEKIFETPDSPVTGGLSQ